MNRVDLDDAARRRLIATHRAALIEVASTVSDALIDELVTLGVEPLSQDASLDQLKVAQAQLLGWVNGVVLEKATLGTLTQKKVLFYPAPEWTKAQFRAYASQPREPFGHRSRHKNIVPGSP